MTATKRFEEFSDFIHEPLVDIIKSFYPIGEIEKRLQSFYNNILSEARNNYIDSCKNGADSSPFFSDMVDKTTRLKERNFNITSEGIYHRETNTKIDNKDSIESEYSFLIYNELDAIVAIFEKYEKKSLTSISGQLGKPSFSDSRLERKTKIPSFNVKNPSVLNDSFSQLIKFGFIHSDTPKKEFVDIFTGRVIKNQVLWTGDNNALAYFIRGIKNKKAIFPVGNDHWIITKNCFAIGGKEDYDTDILRNSDPPEDTETLDMIIYTFSQK
jgi:hypothetical protein